MSSIEWTDRTWNPVRGCSRVSEGCRHCYAERMAARFAKPGKPFHGFADASRSRMLGPSKWTGRVELVPEKLDEPLRWRDARPKLGRPLRVFVNSMSDLFHEALSDEAIAAVFGVMASARRHTFQVLTKRPERMRRWFETAATWPTVPERKDAASVCRAQAELHIGAGGRGLAVPLGGDRWPLPNVWLGVSVEDRKRADERIPLLLQTPAAKRFISYEPALGPLDVEPFVTGSRHFHGCADVEGTLRNRSFHGLCSDDGRPLTKKQAEDELRLLRHKGVKLIPGGGCDDFDPEKGCRGHRDPRLDWVIVGGESGPSARPFDLAWARSVVAQCREAGVACFVKQLGARVRVGTTADDQPAFLAWCGGADVHRQGDEYFARLKHPKGGDPAEWPEDLRVREFPR